MQIILLHLIEN